MGCRNFGLPHILLLEKTSRVLEKWDWDEERVCTLRSTGEIGTANGLGNSHRRTDIHSCINPMHSLRTRTHVCLGKDKRPEIP